MKGARSLTITWWCVGIVLAPLLPTVTSGHSDSGPDTQLEAVLAAVKERERSLRTFTARFTQTRKTRLLKEPLISTGLIYFDAAGKLLLKVTQPAPFLVLFKDNFLTLYDPEAKEVQERYLGPGDLFKRYFGLGGSVEDLRGQYAITLVSDAHPDGILLRLEPRKGRLAGRVSSIDTAVRPNDWIPVWISIREAEGDETAIRLDYTSFNEPLPPGVFDLPLPAGSDNGLR